MRRLQQGATWGCGPGTYGNEREAACPVDSDAKWEFELGAGAAAVVEASVFCTAGERGCLARPKVDLSDAVGTKVLRCIARRHDERRASR